MFIRPLTREDLPQAVDIADAMFVGDSHFAWLYPRFDRFPDDVRDFHRISLRNRLVLPGSHGFVMASEEADDVWTGKSEVLGFVFYVRKGDDEAARAWQRDSLSKKLERYLLSWEKFYVEKFWDRAAGPGRMAAYRKLVDYGFYAALEPRWHVGVLGVSPKFQRRGIGAQLVQFGQKLAAKENIPMTLEASVAGRGLYVKKGFKVVDEREIAAGLDSVAMVWEPDHLRGKWLQDRGPEHASIIGWTEQ